MNRLIILIASFFAFISCCNDDDSPVQTEVSYLPVKYTAPTFVETYTYINTNKLKGIYQIGNNNSFQKNAVAEYKNDIVEYVLVTYTSSEEQGGYAYNQKYTFFRDVPGEVKVKIDFVDNKGYENVKIDYYKVDPETGRMLPGFGLNVEYDEKGNMIKFENQTHNVEISYDDKRGVYSDVKPNELPLAIIHNSAKYFKINNPVRFIDNEMRQDLYYEYNAEGFPIKMTALDNGQESVFLYEYLKVEK